MEKNKGNIDSILKNILIRIIRKRDSKFLVTNGNYFSYFFAPFLFYDFIIEYFTCVYRQSHFSLKEYFVSHQFFSSNLSSFEIRAMPRKISLYLLTNKSLR